MKYVKYLLAKIWLWNILAADENTPDRIVYFSRLFFVATPVTVFFQMILDWYFTNEAFVHGNTFLIGLNAILGGWMHFRKGDFSWESLLIKTLKILALGLIVYAVLEIVISRGGDYGVIAGFRAALQIVTLLYPGTKILKNVYILSNGEYPPTWIMRKVYNFQADGDLSAFLSTGATPPPYNSDMEDEFNEKYGDDE